MSAATPSTASSTSSTSKSPTPSEPHGGGSLRRQAFAAALRLVHHRIRSLPRGVAGAGRAPARARPVPVRRGRGGAADLQAVDRRAAAALRPGFRSCATRPPAAVPVGMLYDDIYHTVVVAPATSNTVAKCAFGISDTLPTNMFAQAGKLGIPGIVFACDTEPVVVTQLAARLGDAAAAADRTRQRRAAARHRLLPGGVPRPPSSRRRCRRAR